MKRAKLLLLVYLGIMMILLFLLPALLSVKDTLFRHPAASLTVLLRRYTLPWYAWVTLVLFLALWLMVLRTPILPANVGIASPASPLETPISFRRKWVVGNGIAWAAAVGFVLSLLNSPPLLTLFSELISISTDMVSALEILLSNNLAAILIGATTVLGSLLAVAQWQSLAPVHPHAGQWVWQTFFGMMFGSIIIVAPIYVFARFVDLIDPNDAVSLSIIFFFMICGLPGLFIMAVVPFIIIFGPFLLGGMLAARWQTRLPGTGTEKAAQRWRKRNPWYSTLGALFGPLGGFVYGWLTASLVEDICFNHEVDLSLPQTTMPMDLPVS